MLRKGLVSLLALCLVAALPPAGPAAAAGTLTGTSLPVVIVAPSEAVGSVVGRITGGGGRVESSSPGLGLVTGRVPPAMLPTLLAIPGVTLTIDHPLQVLPAATAPDWHPGQPRVGPGESLVNVLPFDLQVTRQEIRADAFSRDAGVNGGEITVAVIDTGVDLSNPDLGKTPSGTGKVVEWVDFTDESTLDTTETATAADGKLKTKDGTTLTVGSIHSASGTFHVGKLEKQIESLTEGLPPAEQAKDSMWVLVVDSAQAGVYDRVYFDASGDKSFPDEQPLAAADGRKISLTAAAKQNPNNRVKVEDFFLAALQADGNKVCFDVSTEHGTTVARIIGGNPAAAPDPSGSKADRGMTGIAPGAQLLALKALKHSGSGAVSGIARAVAYAAEHGARIINLSLGTTGITEADSLVLTAAFNRAMQKYGVIPVVAAGNAGPGLSSITTPGDYGRVIAVGSYVSARMFKDLYGVDIDHDQVLWYSGRGPKKTGDLAVTVVAPDLGGTSFATPHVAGGVALLLQAAQKAGIAVNGEQVRRALHQGARPIPGYSALDQGGGVADLPAAWGLLQRFAAAPASPGAPTATVDGSGDQGVRTRLYTQGSTVLKLDNPTGRELDLKLSESEPWARTDLGDVRVAAGGSRKVQAAFGVPEVPGLYPAVLTADDPATPEVDLQVAETLVVPHRFLADGDYSAELTGDLGAGEVNRLFFLVPTSTAELKLDWGVLRDPSGAPAGRAAVSVRNPRGEVLYDTPFLGAGSDLGSGFDPAWFHRPVTGIWEVDVTSALSLSQYNLKRSHYRLKATIYGIFPDPEAVQIPVADAPTQPGGAHPEAFNGSVSFTNRYWNFTAQDQGLGLAELGRGGETQRVQINHEQYKELDPFHVYDNTMLLQVRVAEPGESSSNIAAILWRADYGSLSWQVEAFDLRNPGNAGFTLDVPNPLPGMYQLMLYGADIPKQGTLLDVTYLPYSNAGGVWTDPAQRFRAVNEHWTVPFELQRPDHPGEFLGQVAVYDVTDRRVLSSVPIQVVFGRRRAAVSLEPKPLLSGSPGEPGVASAPTTLTLAVTDLSAGAPVESGTLVVDGRSYPIVSGRVTFPVSPTAVGGSVPQRYAVHVVLDDPRYQRMEADFEVPVLPAGTSVAPGAGVANQAADPTDLSKLRLFDQLAGR